MYAQMLAKTGSGAAVGGVFIATLDVIWAAIAIAVVGGALVTASKFAPRVAIEPIPVGVNGSRLRLTVNGRPVSLRRRRNG